MKTSNETLQLLNKLSTMYRPMGFVDEQAIAIAQEIHYWCHPKNILEIGFYCGHSCAVWLSKTEANVVSVDTMDLDISVQAIQPVFDLFNSEFPNRFIFIHGNSCREETKLKLQEMARKQPFDFIFIDGCHTNPAVIFNDIHLALSLNVQYLLFDDYLYHDYMNGKRHVIWAVKTFMQQWPNTLELIDIYRYKYFSPENLMRCALFKNLKYKLLC